MWLLPCCNRSRKTHKTTKSRIGITGEPCAWKHASTVWGGMDGKGPAMAPRQPSTLQHGALYKPSVPFSGCISLCSISFGTGDAKMNEDMLFAYSLQNGDFVQWVVKSPLLVDRVVRALVTLHRLDGSSELADLLACRDAAQTMYMI